MRLPTITAMDPRELLVVFDLGGVVVRICRSWQEACAAAGVPFHPAVASAEQIASRKAVHHEYERGRMACGEFFQAVAQRTGGLYTAEAIRAIHDAWILEEYPGVGELIEQLHHLGVSTGVLSNTNHSHWVQLVGDSVTLPKFPTPGRVRHCHASHLLGMAKPDAEIYHEFARRVALDWAAGVGGAGGERDAGSAGVRLRAENILFFDDLKPNIDAAREAGWRAEQIDHTGDPAAQMREILGRAGILVP